MDTTKPVAWMDEKGEIYRSPRLHFLGLIDESCGSRDHIWSGTSLAEAGEAWKRFVAQGSKDVNLTGWNCGMIATHQQMEYQYGEARATAACPICGQDTPHQHSADEIASHRRHVAWWQEQRAKDWKAIEDRVARLAALYPERTALYAAPLPAVGAVLDEH